MTANYKRVIRAAAENRNPQFSACDSPANSDAILFVESGEPFFGDILRSPLYKKYRHKCLIFDSSDRPVPMIPGMYVNVENTYRRQRTVVGGFYIRVFDNDLFEAASDVESPKHLFSFVGRMETCPSLRSRVLRLRHPLAFVRNMGSGQSDSDINYVRTIKESQFVLCPRGIGNSSWRLFETMRAGRVPVIISDNWRRPPGIDWDTFSIQVRERDVEQIPSLLEKLEHRASTMGRIAFDAWQTNFSKATAFGYLGRQSSEIIRARATEAMPTLSRALLEIYESGQLVHFGKTLLRRLIRPEV